MRLIVSDLHLGNPESQYKKLLLILAKADFTELYLAGDIFDLWVKDFLDIKRDCFDFFKTLDDLISKGIVVNYFLGNHDEEIDVTDPVFDRINIKLTDLEIIADKKVKFFHGDRYDYLMKNYSLAFKFCAWFFSLFGSSYQTSLSSKRRTKNFAFLLNEIKETAIKENSHVDVLIMGHTHIAEDVIVDGIRYINSGDWINNNSYIVDENGKFELRRRN